MVLAFNSPAARAFLNAPQQPTPNSYNNAAAVPWSFPMERAGGGSNSAPEANNNLESFSTSPPSVGMGQSQAPVWYAATAQAAREGGQQTLAASLASVAAPHANDQGA